MSRLPIRLAVVLSAVLFAGRITAAEKPEHSEAKPLGNSIGMKFVLLPAGEFLMGAPDSDDMGMAHEKPQHRVRITRPFCLGACEVTQGQYQRVMGKNPSRYLSDVQRPVESLSWSDAVEFCRRLGELPEEKAAGAAYRLPTEAEWEYACRAGATTRYCFGDEKEKLADYAWYPYDWPTTAPGVPAKETPAAHADSKRFEPRAVGQKKPNAWGLYDMHGNVWEWCSDWYGPYQAGSPVDDPAGPASGSTRVIRGGSARDIYPAYLRCTMRTSMKPNEGGGVGADCGFRIVKDK
jgi:formylglycine-generating enzyme required for sulfatase activity